MTTVYFVRHCQPDFTVHDDKSRPLAKKGLEDRKLVTAFLEDKAIDVVLSSPYRRAVETVEDFAERFGFSVQMMDDFRERKVDDIWIEDFQAFTREQWHNFSYKLESGESLTEVQTRNIQALRRVMACNLGKNIVIGSHGTALSTVIQFYQNSFCFEDFDRIRNLMPWIVRFSFSDECCVEIMEYDLINKANRKIL